MSDPPPMVRHMDSETHSSAALVDELRGLLATASPVRARKAVRELITVLDDGQALELAARFAAKVNYSSELLLRQWQLVADPDGFCEVLLAPAFARETRTELRVRRVASLRGLRHLTTLRKLHIDKCKEVTDLTDLAGLTGLVELDLNGCAGIEDLTPLSGLTALTHLNLHRCRGVADVRPLLTLGNLRHLDLSMTNVRSVDGFAAAFPYLLELGMRGCRSFRDVCQLAGLTRLADLDLGWTGIRDLRGIGALPALTRLNLNSCASLTTLTGASALTGLTELEITDCRRLKTLSGLGSHPHITRLDINGCTSLHDLHGLSGLTGLTRLTVKGSEHLTALDGLQGTPLQFFRAEQCPALTDFSALAHVPRLNQLVLVDLSGLIDLSALPVMPAMETARIMNCPSLVALDGIAHYPALKELWISGCTSLESASGMSHLSVLQKLLIRDCPGVENLGAAGSFPDVDSLELHRLPSLADIGGVSASRIDSISMIELPLVRSLMVLKGLTSLRKLSLSRCPSVEDLPTHIVQLEVRGFPWTDLSPMKGMESLTIANIHLEDLRDINAIAEFTELVGIDLDFCRRVEDWSPLLAMPSLQRIRFDPNRGRPSGFEPVLAQLSANGVVHVKWYEDL